MELPPPSMQRQNTMARPAELAAVSSKGAPISLQKFYEVCKEVFLEGKLREFINTLKQYPA